MRKLLTRDDIPGYEGVQFVTGARDPWSFDDTGNYLKHGLSQIEIERKDAIAARYDREHEIQKDALVDPWTPLRELTTNLLPHLSFERIDSANRTNVRVLWRVHAKDTVVDLDDLSSGEKSVIQIFYPLVETHIKALLREIQGDATPQSEPELCILIDEPELHLHPNLQVKVFDYLRLLAFSGPTQVIVATHSPTIVEYASFDELFILRPVETVSAGENQLVQLATNEERLGFLRELFGTTSNLTAMQPIVIVEGAEQIERSKTISDRKLYRALHPGFDRVTLIAGGGKADCLRLFKAMDGAIADLSPNLSIRALLDRDLAEGDPIKGVRFLPVSMIENWLLDPNAIWEAVQSVVEKTQFRTVEDLAAAIDATLSAMEEDEIERRALNALGTAYFRPSAPVNNVPGAAGSFAADVTTRFSDVGVADALQAAKSIVETIKAQTQRRELFHGKKALNRFFKANLHATGLPVGVFRYEAARHARQRKAVLGFLDKFFAEELPGADAPVVGQERSEANASKFR
ncbi:MAG: ATP-dependent endonuclease [Gemmatimonadaceae bacterium]